MEPVVHAVTAPGAPFPRRTFRGPMRGASSHFVGSSIIILSSFAVSTLAMNLGKKFQESRHLKVTES